MLPRFLAYDCLKIEEENKKDISHFSSFFRIVDVTALECIYTNIHIFDKLGLSYDKFDLFKFYNISFCLFVDTNIFEGFTLLHEKHQPSKITITNKLLIKGYL